LTNRHGHPGLQQRQQLEKMDMLTLGFITQPASLYNDDPAMLVDALKNEKMFIAVSTRCRSAPKSFDGTGYLFIGESNPSIITIIIESPFCF
jgi:hypothetical protein